MGYRYTYIYFHFSFWQFQGKVLHIFQFYEFIIALMKGSLFLSTNIKHLQFFFYDFARFLLQQASGEAVYVNDMPKVQNELYAAFTLADVASATIESLDASEALVSIQK